ncbi:peptide/nickel transport system permease protein [Rhizobiales bacterium GAS191]|jgi:peptide/nickel transport system permease protein|nr:peptide/nickel transport system permease protein [Rhizobiales bacterium GAS113]SEC35208.1 peptide/nickel transport system permease protein [Rhizobiales bacterium GAS188]SEC91994.1 peptide/nickel transport system permease protein [Rhizobiales bacterium GAS191]
MIGFIGKRLLGLLGTLLVASFLVFTVTEFSPGNVARKTLGPFAAQESVDLLYQKLHLNDPLPVRYARWLGVLTGVIADPLQDPALKLDFKDPRGDRYFGNFGYSTLYKLPVNDVIWNRLGNTAILAGIAFALIVPLSLVFGVLAGMREGSVLDRTISVFGIIATSIPEFASGVFLVAIFVVGLRLLPGTSPLQTGGGGWSIASQFVLPVIVLVLYDAGYVVRMVRGSTAEVMNKPYIRTAILKGLPFNTVVWRHAVRNAMIAPFTVLLLQINFLISGVVVTEMVFAYPGFGRMLLEASLFGDIALIEAATLVALAIATTTQLMSDVGYALLNPQIRVR